MMKIFIKIIEVVHCQLIIFNKKNFIQKHLNEKLIKN